MEAVEWYLNSEPLRIASAKGLIRHDYGRWLKSFATKGGLRESLPLCLREGFDNVPLCLREGFDNVWVEIDSTAVASILNGGLSREETIGSLIKDCLDLVKKLSKFRHSNSA
nr:Ribonuclease H protein [Ipomoea batatas]